MYHHERKHTSPCHIVHHILLYGVCYASLTSKYVAFHISFFHLNLSTRPVGSPIEIMYKLQTFGISHDQIPINSNTGEVKVQNHLKWLNMRQALEGARASGGPGCVFRGIECPSHQDVLLGRGRPIVNHRGNVAMRQRVEDRLIRFAAATNKDEKAAIVWEVVQETHQNNGRFLREDPGKKGWWEEVDDEVAKSKVSVYFRDLKCNIRATTTTATTMSTTTANSSTITPASPTVSSTSSSPIPDSPPLDGARGRPRPASSTSTDPVTDRITGRRQEFDSSTYEFLGISSSREGKRSKVEHYCGGGDTTSCGFFL